MFRIQNNCDTSADEQADSAVLHGSEYFEGVPGEGPGSPGGRQGAEDTFLNGSEYFQGIPTRFGEPKR